jgi:5'-3' exonuclease
LLKKSNITPVIVFDGGKLKIKSKIEKGRNKNREDNKLKA